MSFLIPAALVALFVLAMRDAPKPPKQETQPEPKDPENGPGAGSGLGSGTDWGKVGASVGGIATSAVALGHTIVGALGGGGAAAGAGTAGAGGAGAAGSGTVISGGTVAGGTTGAEGGAAAATTTGGALGDLAASGDAAFAAVSGVSTGLEALAGVSPIIIGVAFLIALDRISAAINDSAAAWSRLENNKRRQFFQGWFNDEEAAVQAYLDKLAESRGLNGSVAHTKSYAQYIDDVDVGGFGVGSGGGYYVDSVQDPQAIAELPTVRAIARMFAIMKGGFSNNARANFWTCAGQPPPPGREVGGVFDQNGTPAVLDADYWRFAAIYLATQPFAAVRYTSGALSGGAGGSFSAGGISGAATGGAGSSQAQTTSYQPYGNLPARDWEALKAYVGSRVGNALYGRLYKEAQLQGQAAGMTLPAINGYQLFYPGDWDFTQGILDRCGVSLYRVNKRVADNSVHTIAIDDDYAVGAGPDCSVAVDVAMSRKLGRPVVVRKGELQ